MNSDMKIILLSLLFLASSCATKYIIPGNRFITPETQGEAFRGQIEVFSASATQATVNFQQGSVDDGVLYQNVSRFGFMYSNSFFDSFDLVWTHTGGGNSLLGGKFQFIGSSKNARGDGHKMSVAALFGGNEHETDNKSIEFDLTGREFLLLYGYRFGAFILPYTSFSYATYNFEGTMKPSGLKPTYDTNSMALNMGVEFTFESVFAKFEATYQQLATTDTKDKQNFIYGYSVGFAW